MLEPEDRHLLVDALRPPEGFELDRAIATTFTLDLDALLVAPLAFALYDWATDPDGRPDPLALLEALRRHADRTTVFCQAGEIGFRSNYRPLVVLIEDSVIPVVPPDPDAIFHPKLWLLRFVAPEAEVRYRLLVPSRNLTFDRSWDSLLVLDGEPQPDDVEASRPLAEMLRRLPALATVEMDQPRAADVHTLADEVQRVRFHPPDGFTGPDFHPIGLGRGWPLPDDYDRALVVSPFLTRATLSRLTNNGSDHALVSSPDAITAVGRDGIAGFRDTFILSSAALPADDADEVEPEAADGAGTAPRPELDGLHAKLYLLEEETTVRLFTGSANATDAAFHGNVELLVEMTGTAADHGIDRLLALDEDGLGFRTLLDEYRPADDAPPEPSAEEQLELDLDRLQRAIARLDFTVELQPVADEQLDAQVTATGDLPLGLNELSHLEVWPISLGAGHRRTLERSAGGLDADLGTIAASGVTAFLAIRAVAERSGMTAETAFVVPATLIGAPTGRAERVLTSMLKNQQELLRYLLFLLADAELDLQALIDALSGDRFGSEATRFERVAPPLLETMLRALSSEPTRLDHVAKLLEDLRDTDEGRGLLPDGLDDIWGPIWSVRQELG